MTIVDRWLLPDGVEELLPAKAAQLEELRRRLLDLYHCWGYDLVMPPLIEFVESLLAGMGDHQLDLQTFKVTDQLTGRLMGIRADMTPQVARMDAHSLQKDEPVRLCYAGAVLHTQAASLNASRCPIQIGAELYGHAGVESDVEIICLMLATLQCAGIAKAHIDIGHVGIYRELIKLAQLGSDDEQVLFDAMQRKAHDEIKALVDQKVRDKKVRGYLIKLPTLVGNQTALKAARKLFADAKHLLAAIDYLHALVDNVMARNPHIELGFDLSELRGYHYHSGVVFAAYVEGCGEAIAKGGRYDDIGLLFGRARAATGFSVDMSQLISLLPTPKISAGILAPADVDAALWQVIEQLRAQQERVVVALPGKKATPQGLGCDRILKFKNGQWDVVPAPTH